MKNLNGTQGGLMLIPYNSKVSPKFIENEGILDKAHSPLSQIFAEKYHGKASTVLSHFAGGYHRIRLDDSDKIIILHYSQLSLMKG